MASIRVEHSILEWETLLVEIYIDNEYPDALSEAAVRARALIRDMYLDVMEFENTREKPDAE